ncbi:MAG: hypothetical protein M0002_08105 [Rhodospirillales bacterium]|nr:hypothetical protein [Rhodospirillales bacterium]
MSNFAQIVGGEVVTVVVASSASVLDQTKTWVQVDTLSPEPGIGWGYNGSAFAAPAPPVPTLAQQAAAALGRGVAVTSSGTPALDGTYAIDAASQAKIQAVSLFIVVNGKFPSAVASYPWLDTAGAAHLFPTTAEFQAFATAIADYVAALDMIIATGSGTLPGEPVAIP